MGDYSLFYPKVGLVNTLLSVGINYFFFGRTFLNAPIF